MKLKFCYVSGGVHPRIGQVLHSVQIVSDSDEAERYQRYLANAIGSVARDIASCDRLLELISAVESGDESSATYDADDVELTIAGRGVQVDINANDEWVGNLEGCIGLEQWKTSLEGWKRFLALPQDMGSVVEVEIPSA
jgi:hypothetical protein